MTQEKKVQFAGMLEERLCAYARSVAHFPTALKEFKVRSNSIAQNIISTFSTCVSSYTKWMAYNIFDMCITLVA